MTTDAIVTPVREMKCAPGPFDAILSGVRPFEVTTADKDYHRGDVLHLHEHNPATNSFGRECWREVTYLLRGGAGGLREGWVILGLKMLPGDPAQPAPAPVELDTPRGWGDRL